MKKYLSLCLKWFFVIFVPLFSLALIAAGAYMIWDAWGNQKKIIEAAILIMIGFIVWHNEGGFIGFRPTEIKAFLKNWGKYY